MGELSLEPGAIFASDFRLVRLLASGGMGSVYVVDQLSTGRPAALKLMRPELALDAAARRRFELEAKIGARVESDNVVDVLAAGVDEETGAPYIVMELLLGEDLASRIARGPIPLADALVVFTQLCTAVGKAHDAGVVHRDLKPENVFLVRGEPPVVKVLDFGVAKVADSMHQSSTNAVGTPLFMAPEQTERGKVTARADVWALGLIAYRMLTGNHFWRSAYDRNASLAQLMREVVLAHLPAASVRAREQGVAHLLPPGFDAFFSQCVAREPERRLRNATEVLDVFRRVASNDLAFAATAPTPMSLPRPRGPALLDAQVGTPLSEMTGTIRLVVAGIAVFGFCVWFAFARYMASQRDAAAESEWEDGEGEIVLPPSASTSSGAVGTVISPAPPPAGVSGAVVALEPATVPADLITPSIERVLPRLESCAGTTTGSGRRRLIRRGTVTVSFVVKDHEARSRNSPKSTMGDAVTECVLDGLHEASFPTDAEGVRVTYDITFR